MIRALCLSAMTVAGLAMPLPVWSLELPSFLRAGETVVPVRPPRPIVSEIVEDKGEDARSVPGMIVSRTQVALAFQTLGRMTERYVDLGDQVERGNLLAELATDDLAASTRAAQAALDSAQVQLSTARSTAERTSALAARNVASAAQLEQAQRSALSAEAETAQARSRLLQAEDAESFAKMTAPFGGVISAVYKSQGAVVGAGAQIMQLSALDRRDAVIDLPEAALSGIMPGDEFTVWQRSDPGVGVPAVLDRIETQADAATRTRRLYLTLPEDAPYRLGSLIRARLGGVDRVAISVPEQALFMKNGIPHVWIVDRNDDGAIVTARPVMRGGTFEGRVRVSQGLRIGDEVVIRGAGSLQEGQAVGRRESP